MFLHSCAHLLHESAHCLHISILPPIFSHSIAHATHMSAQSLHIIMHLPIIPAIWVFDAVMHSVQQASQAIMHSLQLSMQPEYCWFFNMEIVVLFISLVCPGSYLNLSKKYEKNVKYMRNLHIIINKFMIISKCMRDICIQQKVYYYLN